jgi:hypothetical protein
MKRARSIAGECSGSRARGRLAGLADRPFHHHPGLASTRFWAVKYSKKSRPKSPHRRRCTAAEWQAQYRRRNRSCCADPAAHGTLPQEAVLLPSSANQRDEARSCALDEILFCRDGSLLLCANAQRGVACLVARQQLRRRSPPRLILEIDICMLPPVMIARRRLRHEPFKAKATAQMDRTVRSPHAPQHLNVGEQLQLSWCQSARRYRFNCHTNQTASVGRPTAVARNNGGAPMRSTTTAPAATPAV